MYMEPMANVTSATNVDVVVDVVVDVDVVVVVREAHQLDFKEGSSRKACIMFHPVSSLSSLSSFNNNDSIDSILWK